MLEDDLFAIIDPALRTLGSIPEPGEEYRTPPLDVLRYYRRPVRLHWIPVLGRASSIVAVVRQPIDVAMGAEGYRRFLTRLAHAVNGRFPPWRDNRGVAIGLTAVVLTPEPITPEDDAVLGTVLGSLGKSRSVLLGLIRINLGQEALAFALAPGPDQLFAESEILVDALTPKLRRFVPLIAP